MKTRFRFWVGVSLVLVYMVIAAGAIVRVTGSGMGCPDWPKCFGYLIPPTEREQLDWNSQYEYSEGEVIIVDEILRVAKTDFISSSQYVGSNWEAYTKHDYAHFNAFHTWVEFVNRLAGALAGIATLIVGVLSIRYWKKKKRIPILSLLIILGMGFQAWLGKTVVDSNLLPAKITVHMVMALLIVALLVYLYAYTSPHKKEATTTPSLIKKLGVAAIVLTLIQIGIGTQIRQFIDIQIDFYGLDQAAKWLNPAPFKFYFHRSFSLLIVLINGYLFYKLRKMKLNFPVFKWILFTLICEVFTGILMYYLDFPFASQPLHLLLASFLFGGQLYFLFQLFHQNINTPSHDL